LSPYPKGVSGETAQQKMGQFLGIVQGAGLPRWENGIFMGKKGDCYGKIMVISWFYGK
jgi:hypothetical protein